ncbi:MAG TPA: Hsp70 family protein, partial [Myxococcota bacterium]|nr:Hsp70 family protein [Myxococcota bacterium]
EAVITVPAYFTDAQRQATREAGVLAGLKVERILNEPTAAALAYGLTHLDQEAHVLVYDLGGGTFDVSVLEMYSGVLEVRASSGNARLGGADFDALVVQWLLEQIQRAHGLDLSADRGAMARLKLAAEQAKIELSARTSATIQLPFLAMKEGHPISPLVELDRPTFEALIGPLVRSTLEPVAAALRDAKLVPAQIGEILLVGGSSRIPLVQRLVEEYFHKKPRFEVNPDEAVALGAAIQAGLKAGAFSAETGIMITDVAPFTLGVESSRRVGQSLIHGFFLPIIPRNSTIPITRSQVVNTVADGQTQVTIRVFQGDDHLCKNNVFLDEYTLQDIPPGRAGQERLEIAFTYDINGILQVKTTILSTSRAASLQITRAAPSPDSQARLSADYSRSPTVSLEDQVGRLLSQGKAEAAVELAERHAATSPGPESRLLLARALLGAERQVPAERILRELLAEGWTPARAV